MFRLLFATCLGAGRSLSGRDICFIFFGDLKYNPRAGPVFVVFQQMDGKEVQAHLDQ